MQCIRKPSNSLECKPSKDYELERFGGLNVLNRWLKWSREVSNTQTPSIYSSPPKLVIMGKLPSFCALADGPRPLTGRSTLHFNNYFLFKKHFRAIKKVRHGWSADPNRMLATWELEYPELCPPDFNMGGRSTEHSRTARNLRVSTVHDLGTNSLPANSAKTYSPCSK